MRIIVILAALIGQSIACGKAPVVDGGLDSSTGDDADVITAGDADQDEDVPSGPPPRFVIGTWNLHNFSAYGLREYRTVDIVEHIETLDVDLLGVQEIKLEDGTTGDTLQAFDALVQQLEGFNAIRNPWSESDTTVGLLYRRDVTTIVAHQPLFEGEWYAFPRPPLEARVTLERDGRSVRLNVIVVHLKAYAEDLERRRAAWERLDAYLRSRSNERYIVIGDFNDDPYDAPASNAFTGTVLDAEPTYYFVTASLPPESVTSVSYYHFVDGRQITGEFIDHVVVMGGLYESFTSWTPVIMSVPEYEYVRYEAELSDHFPVVVTAEP